MGYIIRQRKANGDRIVERVDGSRRVTVKRRMSGAAAIIVKERGKKRAAYNFNRKLGGKSLSKQAREANIRRHLQALRQDYRHTKGMSKGGTMKHVASIPPEIFWSEAAENGPEAIHDAKHMLRLAKEWGFRVS